MTSSTLGVAVRHKPECPFVPQRIPIKAIPIDPCAFADEGAHHLIFGDCGADNYSAIGTTRPSSVAKNRPTMNQRSVPRSSVCPTTCWSSRKRRATSSFSIRAANRSKPEIMTAVSLKHRGCTNSTANIICLTRPATPTSYATPRATLFTGRSHIKASSLRPWWAGPRITPSVNSRVSGISSTMIHDLPGVRPGCAA